MGHLIDTLAEINARLYHMEDIREIKGIVRELIKTVVKLAREVEELKKK